MAQSLPVLSFIIVIIVKCAFGVSVHGLVGDLIQFPVPESCEPAKLHRVGEHLVTLVSERVGGVCYPAEEYKGRVNETSCFTFSRAFYADSGEYELKCNGSVRPIHISLKVVYGAQVLLTEGEPGRLPCYMTRPTGNRIDSIRWIKGDRKVLEHKLDTGNTTYGRDFEAKVSLPSDGAKEGDWSLIWSQVQLQDEGVYYCPAFRKGIREAWGSPAAVRLKVMRRNLDQTTPSPPFTTTQNVPKGTSWTFVGWTALLTFVIVAPLFSLLGWYLKTGCRPGEPPAPGGGQYTQAKGEINGNVPDEMLMSSV